MPIRIGAAQAEQIAQDRDAAFRGKLIAYIHSHRATLRKPDATRAELEAAADAALNRCAALKMEVEIDIATYAARALEFGPDWETQDRFALSHSILKDPEIAPDDKIGRMQQAEMAAEFDPYANKDVDLFEEAS